MLGLMTAVAKVRRELASRQALIQQLETKCSDILQAAAMDQARAGCRSRLHPFELAAILYLKFHYHSH